MISFPGKSRYLVEGDFMMRRTLCVLLIMLGASTLAAETLRTVAQDNALGKYSNDDPSRPGLCRELAQAVSNAEPSLQFQGLESLTPLPRIEKLLENDGIDIFFCLLKNRHREARFHFIDVPLYTIRHVLLVKADDPVVINGYEDLHALGDQGVVLVSYGSSLVHVLQEAGVKVIDSAKSDNQLIRMLKSGRGRFIYGQDLLLREMLRRSEDRDQYRFLPVVLKEEAQYLAYSRKLNREIVKRLEKTLRGLSQSGGLDFLMSRYR